MVTDHVTKVCLFVVLFDNRVISVFVTRLYVQWLWLLCRPKLVASIATLILRPSVSRALT